MNKETKSYLITSISDDMVRYVTVHNTVRGGWSAKKQILTDAKWRTCWRSEQYANQLGARNAIRYNLGV